MSKTLSQEEYRAKVRDTGSAILEVLSNGASAVALSAYLPVPTGSKAMSEAAWYKYTHLERQQRNLRRSTIEWVRRYGKKQGLCITGAGGVIARLDGPEVNEHAWKVALKFARANLKWVSTLPEFNDFDDFGQQARVLDVLNNLVTLLEDGQMVEVNP